MVKVETHWIGIDGETQSVTTAELSVKAASIYAERVNNDCRELNRRCELFDLDGYSSVQVVHDDQGYVWRAIVYTEHIAEPINN